MSETTTTAYGDRTPRSFTRKKIDITFTIRSGGQAEGGTIDQHKITGYRCQVEVTNAGLREGASANIRIYNLPLPLMNRMSLMPARIEGFASTFDRTTLNTVIVEAGDDERGMTTIFCGVIFSAFADFSSVPEPAFNITCWDTIKPTTDIIAPHSFPEGASVAEMVSQIASEAGYAFVNNGVNIRSKGPKYYHGSMADQIRQIHDSYRFVYKISNEAGADDSYKVTLWSQNLVDLRVSTIPKVSAKTGLIGYPAYSNYGVTLTSLFDHRLQFMTTFAIESNFLPAAWVNNQSGQVAPMPANGNWVANMVTHELDSEIPNGRWFTHIEAIRTDYAGQFRTSS